MTRVFRDRSLKTMAARLAVLLLAGILTACGSDPGPRDPAGPQDPGTPPAAGDIVGGELIGWDQLAPSVDDARAYAYALYVDGTRSGALGGISCDPSASAVGYRCSAVLPTLPRGSHTLQISSSSNGLESPLSGGISVNVR